MSHFTKLSTQIKDLNILKEVVGDMHLTLVIGRTECRGYNGKVSNVDAIIRGKDGYDIGFFLTENGTYEVIADWWGAEREFGNSNVFLNRISTSYAEKSVVKTAKKNRWTLSERSESGDTVMLRFKQW